MLSVKIKKALLVSAFFIAFFSHIAGASSTLCPSSQINEVRDVKYVHDGDTLKLRSNQKVRLLGIDTPELARQQAPDQAFARQAKLALQTLVQNNHQKIGLAFEGEKFDKYKRQLAHLYLSNGESVQAILLSQGLATAFTTPPNRRFSNCYKNAEIIARTRHIGIWSLPQYQLKNISQLNKKDRGFRRVRGRVSQAYQGKKGFWIKLNNKLNIQIRNQDLIYFNRHELQQLSGKTIQLRGWLHPNKQGFYMNLRHPDNMSRMLQPGSS